MTDLEKEAMQLLEELADKGIACENCAYYHGSTRRENELDDKIWRLLDKFRKAFSK